MLRSLLRWTLVFVIWSSASLAGPLHDAVKDGDLARLQELIEAGEDLAAQDKLFGTALHWSAFIDNANAARLLIDAGADVNVQRISDQQTALHTAVERGSLGVATLLIDAGADLEAHAADGTTPLCLAAGADRVDTIGLLVDAGADIFAPGIRNATLMDCATITNSVRAIEQLVARGADVNAKVGSGKTALTVASYLGRVDAVRKLVELGADVNGAPDVEPVFPTTPLANAIAFGHDEIADILREAGAKE